MVKHWSSIALVLNMATECSSSACYCFSLCTPAPGYIHVCVDFTWYCTSQHALYSTQCVLDPAREAFGQFLRLYPYCYGYWKKYADLIKKLCDDEKAREVLEEGVTAIPLSVDLWLHYATFAVSFYSGSPQGEELIRRSS